MKQQIRNHTLNKKPLKWLPRLTAGSVHKKRFFLDCFYNKVTVQIAKSSVWFWDRGDTENY